jgi:transcriptional regulator with XRE-family HTH domain
VDLFAYIGETLRRLRKERGKTLEEIGQEAGLGRGQLSRIENARQEATLTTLSKILVSQGVSRREFFHRYELVEEEAQEVERSEGAPAPAAGQDEWPEEVRHVLKRVEAFVTAAFLQPRPVAQGTFELGDLVVLFRIVSKTSQNAPPEKEGETPGAPSSTPPPSRPRGSRASVKRPARRRKAR